MDFDEIFTWDLAVEMYYVCEKLQRRCKLPSDIFAEKLQTNCSKKLSRKLRSRGILHIHDRKTRRRHYS